ncbi:hypothetical protein J8A87_23180 [Vibrio parahaemolyticus]|uniref:Uncharacterized protein n=1 Tax=Vibrio vulnificus TaxID=672 RepID=A0AAN1PV25_VIBVL|nr:MULTISPECIES: hypothetical protein [Vibrio]AXX63391.1 hypothetical protein FORC53_5052 [Vibrio vulnificus]MBE4779383.1 hypothetical protein [Vibrio parahaemolyticus]MCF9167350.1 hypothetical protein [Vibrio parahaemolyticus]MDW1964013.1 hypothetical protein [Vibrio sp. Vb0587]
MKKKLEELTINIIKNAQDIVAENAAEIIGYNLKKSLSLELLSVMKIVSGKVITEMGLIDRKWIVIGDYIIDPVLAVEVSTTEGFVFNVEFDKVNQYIWF